jgi:hypothetical protein
MSCYFILPVHYAWSYSLFNSGAQIRIGDLSVSGRQSAQGFAVTITKVRERPWSVTSQVWAMARG